MRFNEVSHESQAQELLSTVSALHEDRTAAVSACPLESQDTSKASVVFRTKGTSGCLPSLVSLQPLADECEMSLLQLSENPWSEAAVSKGPAASWASQERLRARLVLLVTQNSAQVPTDKN